MSIRTRRWVTADGKAHEALVIDVEVRLPDGTKRRARQTCPTLSKTDARNMEKGIRRALEAGEPIPGVDDAQPEPEPEPAQPPARKAAPCPTFADFERQFMDDYATVKNKPSEQEAKRTLLRTHLVPYFGNLRLNEITEAQIDAYVAKLLRGEKGLPGKTGAPKKPKTVNNHLAVLSKMLRQAKRWKLIAEVPDIDWLQVRDQPFDFLTFDEASLLLAKVTDEPIRTMILIAMRTGLRPSELRALRWKNVDLQNARLNVRQGEYRGKIGTPKDGDAREVDLSDEAVTALRKHRHLRGEYVFCWEDGTRLLEPVMRRMLDAAVKKAGFREINWYAFRHTFASHLVMRGAPIKVVGELMGHSTIDMTMRYAHLSPAAKRDAVALLDQPATESRAAT